MCHSACPQYYIKSILLLSSYADNTLFLSGTSLPIPPCYVAMDNFSQTQEDGDTWCSTPFYSGPQGYKMRLKVYANGNGDGAGTHVSVYVRIIPGEYDDTLTWPYTGIVTYETINWKDDSNHCEEDN